MTAWDDPAMSRDVAPGPDPAVTPRTLGRGGEGVVVSGRDRHLAREVAWKVVAADDPRGQVRLRHEARVLAMLEHPGIVPVYDLVASDGALRMATRYVRGRTLRALIYDPATGPLAFRRASSLRPLRHGLALAEALAFAHARGVVHRDVKPDNVMVGEFGETQVIDWGLAVVLADDDAIGGVSGTPRHMSPEQARGERPTPAVDVWGLGTILYELVMRRPLWPEEDADRILGSIRRGDRPAIDGAGLPPELVAILERSLATITEARYPDARAFADDLAAFLDGRIVNAHDYSAWDALRRFVRARRLPLGIAAAVLVTLMIGLPLAFNRIRAERDEAVTAREERTAALVRAETTVAIGEHAAGQRPEAERAAINVLALQASPEARGILAALARAPRFELLGALPAAALHDECRDLAVSPDARHVLCGQRTHVAVYALDLMGTSARIGARVFAANGLYRSATLSNDAVWLTRRDQAGVTRVDLATGNATQLEGCSAVLVPLGERVLDVSTMCAAIVSKDATRRLQFGDKEAFQSAGGDADTLAALGLDGTLHVRDAGGTRTVATSLASITRDYAAAAWLAADARRPARLFVGSTRGEVVALEVATGSVVARMKLSPDTMVRSLAIDASRGLVLARLDSGGAAILDASSLALIGRLPRDESSWATLLGQGRVATFGAHLSLWRVPPGAVAGLDGLTGVTALDLARDGTLLATYERSVAVIDSEHGTWLAGTTLSGPDAGIIKGAVRRGPDVIVAVAKKDTGDLPAPPVAASTDPEFLEMRGFRRLLSLADGRLVRAPTGVALELELPGSPTGRAEFVTLDDKRVVDVARADDLLVSLTSMPSRFAVWDLSGPPLLLFTCPDEGASAVGLAATADGPIVLTTQARHVLAQRGDCSVRNVFALPRGEPVRVVATAQLEHGWVAAGTRAGDVLVWDWGGNLRATVSLHLEPVTALTLDPTGRWLVSGAWDGRVRFLDLELIEAPVAALTRASRVGWMPGASPPDP